MTTKATVRAAFSLTGLGNDRKSRIAITIERALIVMWTTVGPGRMGPVMDHGIPLLENDLDADPLRQFGSWFTEAGTAGVREPQAAALATASGAGAPSVRMVLVKSFDECGFVFFSDYTSRKGRELAV